MMDGKLLKMVIASGLLWSVAWIRWVGAFFGHVFNQLLGLPKKFLIGDRLVAFLLDEFSQ